MTLAHLTLNDRVSGIQTDDSNFVLLHGTQQLLQLLLRSHILHLAQVMFLEFHGDSSGLQGSVQAQDWVRNEPSISNHPFPHAARPLMPCHRLLTLNTSLTACMSSGPTPSPGNMVTGKAPSTVTSSACEWGQRRWSRGRSRSQRERDGEGKPRGATRMDGSETGLERTWLCEAA